MEDIKTRLHTQFGPNASPDFDIFVGAMGDMLLQEIENYVSEQDDGAPGWSPLFDINKIPDKGLPWLAQFIGVRLPVGLTPAQQRVRIETTDGWNRGTPAALRGAILPYLRGQQTVAFYERDSSPYHFTIITRAEETPPGDLPSTNYNRNGGSETNITGYFASVAGAGARSNTYAKYGSWSLAYTATGTANEGIGYNSGNNDFAPGDFVVCSVWVRPDATVTMQAAMNEMTSANAFLRQTVGPSIVCPAGVWTRLSVVAILGASAARVEQYAQCPGAHAANTIYMDGWQMEKMIAPPINSTFETSIFPWEAWAGVDTIITSTVARSTAQFHSGAASMLMTALQTGDMWTSYGNDDYESNYQDCPPPGTRITFSGWFRQSSGSRTVMLDIDFWGDDATFPPRGFIASLYQQFTLAAGSWQQFTLEVVVPDGATQMVPYIGGIGPGAIGDAIYLDDIQILTHAVTPYIETNGGTASRAAGQENMIRAITEQKPAGLQFTYLVQSGQEYALVFNNFATYQSVFTTYATYNGLLNAAPGT